MTTPSSTQPRFVPSWAINISAACPQAGQTIARASEERHLELKRPDAADDQPTERDPLTAADTRTTALLRLSPAGDPAELVVHIAGSNSVDDVKPARSLLQELSPDVLYQLAKFLPLPDLARLFPALRLGDEVKSAAEKMMRSVGDIGVLHEARDALSERWERLAFRHQQLAHPPEQVTAALVMVFCCARRSASQKQRQLTHTLAALDATKVEMENLQRKSRDAVFLFGAHRLDAGALNTNGLEEGGATALEKAIARGDVALILAGTRELLAAPSQLMSHKYETHDLGHLFSRILGGACQRPGSGAEDRLFFEGVTALVSGIVSSPNLTKRSKDRLCLGNPETSFIETALSNHNYPAAASILLGIVESAAPMATKIWLMASARESWPRVSTAAAAFEAAYPEWGAELSQRLNTAMAGLPSSLRLQQGC